MLVSDAFKILSLGHLSNLSMSNEGSGQIRDTDKAKIISYMNEALTRLYTRFNLRQREIIIRQYAHITNYQLDSRYAYMNDNRPNDNKPYILDLPQERFSDDAIKILKVYNEHGQELIINDSDQPWAVFTPYPTVLQITNPIEGRPLSVVYQASHIKLEYGVTNSEIFVPKTLEGAFFALISHYVFLHMNTQEGSAKAQEHYASYDAICVDVENSATASVDDVSRGTKFYARGWR